METTTTLEEKNNATEKTIARVVFDYKDVISDVLHRSVALNAWFKSYITSEEFFYLKKDSKEEAFDKYTELVGLLRLLDDLSDS